ncbi:hypothetical protein AB0D14_17230 [Streptomyces sp. NPDC048484]|uniref:hypothetical protein n=1 Tax=Streptomyces sp. NPDC048484 TaxID=3155146 RepID=UPI00343AEA42
MHDSPEVQPARKVPEILHRLVRWTRPRRRAAVGLLLRGVCYGLGTGAVSLATFWVQNRL